MKINLFLHVSTNTECDDAVLSWSSSPHLGDKGKFLVNMRIAYGYHMTGILPNQYNRFCEAANIGVMTDKYLRENVNNHFCDSVQQEYKSDIRQALLEEVGSALLTDSTGNGGISIVTDARHGWHKNSRQTDVPCLGHLSNKVIAYEIVTKDVDPVARRHEEIGTERTYNYLDVMMDRLVYLSMHMIEICQSENISVKVDHRQ